MPDTVRHCPGCNIQLDQGDRFCRNCGIFLESHASEHRYVTVLFSDLTNYSTLSETLDSEDLKELMDRIFGRISQIITRYGGMLEKFIGDAIVALFGILETHEDDAIRAIHAARETHAFIAGLPPVGANDFALHMHTGIYTGTILANQADINSAMGIPFTIAARLSSLAAPGEILIGESSRFEAERHFALSAKGEHCVKGLQKPLSVYSIVSERAIPLSVRRHQTLESRFIGREHDLASLCAAVEAHRQGEGGMIWIQGEAGIGKSRLIHEFRQGIPPDFTWHEAHCLEYARNQPYFPVQMLIRQLDGGTELSQPTESPGPPELPQPEAFRNRYYAYVQDLLARTGPPAILCIEDMQWADPSSMDLLNFLSMPPPQGAPALILLTSRELPPAGFGGQRMALPELNGGEVKAMVSGLLPMSPTEAALDRFIQATGGNPLYVEEMAHYMEKEGQADATPVPLTLKGLISARFDRLGNQAKRALKHAAVLGLDFDGSTLQLIDPQIHEEHLGELVQSGIILPDAARPGNFTFRHAITRDAAYENLVKQERIELHGRVGQVLEGLSGVERSDMLAYHFKQAQDYPKAYRFSLLSAQRCQESGSWMEAAAHYRDSENAVSNMPEEDQQKLALIGIWEGMWQCSRIFKPDLAIHALKRVIEAYADLGQDNDVAFAQVRLINLYAQKARFGEALEAFKEVLPRTNQDHRMRAAAETSLAYVFTYLGNPRVALHYLETSRLNFTADDIFLRAVNGLMTLAAFVWKGCPAEALLWYQHTRRLCRGNVDMELLADVWFGYVNFMTGNFSRAQALFAKIAGAEKILGAMAGSISYLRTQSAIYFLTCYLDRPQQARQDYDTFCRWCASMQVDGAAALMDLYQGWIARAENRLDAARDFLERALPALEKGIANRVPYALNALGEVLLRQQEIAAASSVVNKGLAWNREHGNYEQLVTGLRLMGEIAIASGEGNLALSVLSEGERLARNLYLRPHLERITPLVGRYRERMGAYPAIAAPGIRKTTTVRDANV